MNISTVLYYLGDLARSTTLSPQCTQVRELLLDQSITDDHQRLAKIFHLINSSNSIDADTVHLLRRGIRGHYGGEGYALSVPLNEGAEFWQQLRVRFPENGELCMVAADALYVTGAEGALELFVQALALAPSFAYQLEASVCGALENSEYKLQYGLARLKDSIQRNYQDEVAETLSELRTDFQGDDAALRSIDEVITNGT
ncbi:MAG: hypothetical protein K8L97_05825 [Anaerolineae bacterium]|nr:hypothetical protein [Anaerolineae bacterium]